MNAGARTRGLSAAAVTVLALGLAVSARAAGRPAVDYVVPPTIVSPAHGAISSTNPEFTEPALISTDQGLATVFMENTSGKTVPQRGWHCFSQTGATWSCGTFAAPGGYGVWSDPWLADTHGDPCPKYGNAITLAALEGTTTGVVPISYYSPDYGRTWVGPTILPYPEGIQMPLADGTKMIYTGRTYIAWRDFTFMTGEYVSQLQPDCQWAQPARLTTFVGYDGHNQLGYDDGSDHPRLAATPEAGGVAMRGSFDDNVLTFHRFDSSLNQEAQSIIGPTSPSDDEIHICPDVADCGYNVYDLGTTLLYQPAAHAYVTVYDTNDLSGPNPDGVSLWSKRSFDDGMTWNSTEGLGGPSVDGAYAVMQPTMAYDATTGAAVLAYIEIPSKSSHLAYLQLRSLEPGAANWSEPVTARTFDYGLDSADYFTIQARDGVAQVIHSLDVPSGGSVIEYFSVRYPG